MPDSTIRSRIDPALKAEATQVLSSMGLTMSEAIRLFLKQTVIQGGLPFAVKVPNAETKKALEEVLQNDVENVSLEQLGNEWDDACGK